MRSYYSHLQNTAVLDKVMDVKPILRSSAIFPVFQTKEIKTRLLYMGYWFVKRNIEHLSQVITLRDSNGKVVWRTVETIQDAKAYRVEVADYLKDAHYNENSDFQGSIEIEFYSIHHMVYPYPAVDVNYYNKNSSTIVHVAQRVYNNYEDMKANTETKVPEAGFNIYGNPNLEPFITIINGPEAYPDCVLNIECFNSDQKSMSQKVELGNLEPYAQRTVFLRQHFPLEKFLSGEPGTAKVGFNLNWIFPRLLVGNMQRNPASLSITHTYYDCTDATSQTDYWMKQQEGWYTASLMLPLYVQNEMFTKYYFYPIYSPSSFTIDMEIYDTEGKQLTIIQGALHIFSPSPGFVRLDASHLAKKAGVSSERPLGARLIARGNHGSKLPARIKLGLDIGTSPSQLPCNICTNLQPFNPAWIGKTHSFKWAPILSDRPLADVWIMNSSPEIDYSTVAHVELTIYRESDTSVLKRSIDIPPNGFIIFNPDQDAELSAFLQNAIGWVTAISSNPYTTTYYFSRTENGIVGGDHGF